jgi:hypothetical protein
VNTTALGGDPAAPAWSGHTNRLWLALAVVALVAFAVVGFVAYGSGSPGGTPRQQVSGWVRSTGFGAVVGTLGADNARVARVIAQHRGTGAIHTDCAVLLQDAQAANANLPAPDSVLTNQLAAAYGAEGDAANDCYSAGATNAALLGRSAGERVRAQALLAAALDRVRVLTGVTPPTTTTVPSGAGGIFG